MNKPEAANAPLAGIRIADFTIHAAGPFCTHLLSQLGAESIKIESSNRLDTFRKPHPVYGRLTAATFDQVSSNKLSVRLNLKAPEGVQIAKQIVAISDAATESFRPGVMGRLGLSFEDLRAVKPDVIMMSLSSSGQSGPESHFSGYAPLFGAWGGLGTMSGYSDGPPVEMRHVMDHAAGFHAAAGLVAALHERRRTGKAQYVDVAAREVASTMIGDALVQASAGAEPERPGNQDLAMAPHGVYGSNKRDRWITLAVRTDAQWVALVEVLAPGSPASTDSRFATQQGRRHHRDELDSLVASWLVSRDADETVNRLQAKHIGAHVSWTMQDIADDPHLLERGALIPVSGPGIPERLAVGSPSRFSTSSDVGIRSLTPELGQHEDYVFGELLGMSSAARADLEERGVIQ